MNRKRITWSLHIAALLLIAIMAVSYFTTVIPHANAYFTPDYFNPKLSSFEESDAYQELCFNTANKVLEYSWLKKRVEQNNIVLAVKNGDAVQTYTMDTYPISYYSESHKTQADILWCVFFPRFADRYDPTATLSDSAMPLKEYGWEIENTIQFYQNFEKEYQPDRSNVRFMITQGEKVLFDNGCKNPNYTMTLQKNGDFTTSLDSTNRWVDHAHPYIDFNYTNYFTDSAAPITVSMEIDTAYPHMDAFTEAHNAFKAFHTNLPLLGWMIAAALLWFVTFILLLIFTNDLYAFDKLWLEPFLAVTVFIFCGVGLLFIWIADSVDYRYVQNEADFLLPLLGAALAAVIILLWLIVLIPLLSLVRRLKAHCFWKYSITGKICGGIKRFWQLAFTSQRDGRKVFLCAGIFVLALLIHFVGIFSWSYRESLMQFISPVICSILFFYLAQKLLLQAKSREKLVAATDELVSGNLPDLLHADDFVGDDKLIADNLNNIGTGLKNAVETATKSERMKTELITNVSHDIKTPLTSIINYVDLLKREEIENETANGYLNILEEKAHKLKQLTEDLVEASKASSGNISLEMNRLNFTELLHQVNGEFAEKLEEADLTLIESIPEEALCIIADGRYLWRVLENLYTNALKYAMPRTRVYTALTEENGRVHFSMKNISAEPLNLAPDELTERFTRGDASRNSEGSGLGLSIAKSLTELQNGSFELHLDGDLFRVDLTFTKV